MRIRAAELVGRDRELTELRPLLTGSRSRGGAVFVLGEAGIGKSRLAAEAAGLGYEAGMTVLRGRASTVGPPVPFRPLAEALLALARQGEVPDDPALGPYLAALGGLVPDWRTSQAGTSSSVVLAEAVVRLLRSVGDPGGCLLLLEDLHDADIETLAVVEYLADNLAGQNTILLGTLRAEPGAALDLVERSSRAAGSGVVELARLRADEVARVVASCLEVPVDAVPDGVAVRLFDDSAGNPFVVEELLRHLVASGALVRGAEGWRLVRPAVEIPTGLARAVTQRAERLGAGTLELLRAAAVLGRRFALPVVQRSADLADDPLLEVLHAAVTAQLVVPDDSEPGWYAFQHGLMADALLATTPPARRTALHARAAEAVRALYPDLPHDWCQLAARLTAVAGVAEAAALYLLAGSRALADGAAGSAVALLETAQELAAEAGSRMRAEALAALLYALAESGQLDRAAALADAPHALAGLDPADRVALHVRLAWAMLRSGRGADGGAQVAAARRLAGGTACAALDAVEAHLVFESDDPDRFRRAEELGRRALDGSADGAAPDPAVGCEALHLLGMVARERDLAESDARFRCLHETADAHGLPIWRMYGLFGAGGNRWLSDGDIGGVVEARDLALSIGALSLARGTDGVVALDLVLRGDTTADALLDEALLVAPRLGMTGVHRYLLMVRATAAAHRGDRAGLEAAQAAFAAVGGTGSPAAPLLTGLGRAVCALLEEDRELARRELDAVRPADGTSGSTYLLAGQHGLALLLDALHGTLDPAALGAGPATSMRWNRQFAAAAEAVLAGRAGRAAEALEHARRAAEAAAAYPLAGHLGRRLLGEAALRDGWAGPGTEPSLRAAEEFFHGLPAPAAASACRGLLRQAGATVQQRRAGAERVPGDLRGRGVTAREYEVFQHLVERLGNKAIAARLHISPRTVEKHVAALLMKLDCPDRATLLDRGGAGWATARPARS